MKKEIYILFLFIGCFCFGQNQTISYRFLPNVSSVNLKPISFQINFNTTNLFSKSCNLTLYNATTNLNDNYYILGKSYQMSNTKSFTMNGFEGQRMDSFNPSGTKDFGNAIIFGTINTILNSL